MSPAGKGAHNVGNRVTQGCTQSRGFEEIVLISNVVTNPIS